MKFRLALLTATVLAAPFALPHLAAAQPVTGPYVSLGAGYNIESSQKEKDGFVDGAAVPYEGHVSVKNGFTGVGAVGYGFADGFRAELEGDYIRDNFSKLKAAGLQFPTGGHEARYGVFVNGYYDFDVGLPWLFPYVGAGIGWQESDFNNFEPEGSYFNKTKGALAYQGIAGVSYPIPYAPGLSATLEYRFVALTGSRKYDGSYGPANLSASFKALNEYNNEILVGVRYQLFNAPPPPPSPTPQAAAPAAAPAPAPSKTYLVFFDWDKSDLTPRATQIIAQAASDSKTQNTTTIDVSGYTDTSGTPDYNMGLSQRRASAVEAQLVSDGVAQSEIEIHAYGETHLLVPTGPGVREPQNRRVEIVLQ